MSKKLKDLLPGVGQGWKVHPDELAGMIGLPYVGNVFYVDPSGGSDASNSGESQNDALATVSAAFDKCTGGQHDVVLVAPTGGSGRAAETTAITWNKRFTHLVGSAAPTAQDARAGISFGTGGSLTMSENGCLFKNITFNGTTDINVPVSLTGSYNSFLGVDFKGSLNGTTGDDTAARALVLTGAQENYFGGCAFGSDTFARSAANYTLEFASASSRNVFDGCRFIQHADNVAAAHVLFTGTNAIDRWVEFKDTSWYSFWTNDADKATAVMNLSAQSATGHVLLTGSQMMVGFDDWEASASGRIFMEPHTATTTAIGIGINPT